MNAEWHPFLRQQDIILKVFDNKKTWDSLSHFQKALWLVDETEERWLSLIRKYPKIAYKEVYFESEPGLSDNTLEKCTDVFADLLGLKRRKKVDVVNRHVTNDAKTKISKLHTELRLADSVYLSKTKYKPDWSYLPATYSSYG